MSRPPSGTVGAVLAQGPLEPGLRWFHTLHPVTQTILVGVVTFVVAWLVVRLALAGTNAALRRSSRIDETLRAFLGSVLAVLGWVLIVMATLVGFGVSPATVAGLLAAGAFIIGFALKDTLGNLAAGVVILMNKPYRVGEAVQLKGHDGTVIRLGVAITELKTWDGRHVSVPNGTVLSDAILNWTRNPTRRIDIRVGVAYDDDIGLAVRTMQKTMEEHPLVLKDPAPFIMVDGLGDSSVNIVARPWLNISDLGKGISELHQAAKRELEAVGCTIPFPQRDIHIIPTGGGQNGGRSPRDDGGREGRRVLEEKTEAPS